MTQFTINAPPSQSFIVEKLTDGGLGKSWDKVEEGQLFTGLDIVVGNRILITNEKEDRSLWVTAVQEIIEATEHYVTVRTKNSVYRLRKA